MVVSSSFMVVTRSTWLLQSCSALSPGCNFYMGYHTTWWCAYTTQQFTHDSLFCWTLLYIKTFGFTFCVKFLNLRIQNENWQHNENYISVAKWDQQIKVVELHSSIVVYPHPQALSAAQAKSLGMRLHSSYEIYHSDWLWLTPYLLKVSGIVVS